MEDPETTIREKGWKVVFHPTKDQTTGIYRVYNASGKLIGVGHSLEDAVEDSLEDWN